MNLKNKQNKIGFVSQPPLFTGLFSFLNVPKKPNTLFTPLLPISSKVAFIPNNKTFKSEEFNPQGETF
jgi:hypothetical protein